MYHHRGAGTARNTTKPLYRRTHAPADPRPLLLGLSHAA
jgi:hypothetical protein